jgi:hypothetical protein
LAHAAATPTAARPIRINADLAISCFLSAIGSSVRVCALQVHAVDGHPPLRLLP